MNRNTSLAFALATTLVATACSKTDREASNDATRNSAVPLQSFKAIADQCRGALVESDRVDSGRNGGFVRTIILPKSTSFDVKKTDSLVFPYTAFIKLSFLEQASVGPNQDALASTSTGVVSTLNHWKIDYALQDGKWVLQQALYSFEIPGAGITEGPPSPANVNTLFKRVPDLEAACMP